MRRKIFLYGFTASIIAVLITGVIAFIVMQAAGIEEAKLSAQSMAYMILNDIEGDDQSTYDEKAKSLKQSVSKEQNPYRITIIGMDGEVLGDSNADISSMDNHADRAEVVEAIKEGVGSARRDSATLQINMLYVAVKSSSDFIVRVALPLTELRRMTNNLLLGCLFSILAGGAVSLISSFFFAGRLSKPIKALAYAANDLAVGKLDRRVVLNTNTELDDLAHDFNEMASELQTSLRELRHTNSEFDAVLSSMEDGLIAIDDELKILYINSAAKSIFRVSKNGQNKKINLSDIAYQKPLFDEIKNCLKENKTKKLELKISSDEIRDYEVTVCPMHYKNALAGTIILFTDITHVIELEKLRTDFVANVSHELRTPLTSIKGYAQALKDDGLEDKQNTKRFLEIIEIEADRLNVLINDLMELSKIENKNEDVDILEYNFKDIARDTAALVSMGARKKNVKLVLDIQENLLIMANKDRVKQLLLNLMDNGIKYNKQNGNLTVSAVKQDGMLKIVVSDTGEGISEEDIPRLFERFYRVDKSRSRALGGTGLGLSIVKHIAELYQGSVTVTSKKGVGTEFVVKMLILK